MFVMAYNIWKTRQLALANPSPVEDLLDSAAPEVLA